MAGQKYEFFKKKHIASKSRIITRAWNVDKVQQNDILYHFGRKFSISVSLDNHLIKVYVPIRK